MSSERIALATAVEDIRNQDIYVAALTELQEVREVLEALAIRRDVDHKSWCWCQKRWDATKPHNENCERARALYQRLRVDGALGEGKDGESRL